MTYAIDNDLAPIITTSYGNCEAGWGSTEMNALNQLFKQANAQGQTVLAAAGDSGRTGLRCRRPWRRRAWRSIFPAVHPTSPAWAAPSSTMGTQPE